MIIFFIVISAQSYGSLECPLTGIYWLEGNSRHLTRMISLDTDDHMPCAGSTTLTSGCSAVDKMELLHECSNERRTKCKGCTSCNALQCLYVLV